jgi:hypothetical protein
MKEHHCASSLARAKNYTVVSEIPRDGALRPGLSVFLS